MITALLLTWCFQPGPEVWYGPLRIADRNPLQNFFLTPPADRADTVADGQWQITFGVAFSNIFERAGNESWFQEFDMERLTPGFVLRRGFGEHWEAGLAWQVESTFGGELDGLIQDYHNALGLPNDSRDEVADGSYRFRLVSADGVNVIFDHPKQQAVADDVELFVKRSLIARDDFHAAVRGFVKLPIADDAVSSGGTDIGAALDLHSRHGRYHAHFTFAGAWYGDAGALDPFIRSGAVSVSGALERRMNRPWSIIAQLGIGTTSFRNTGLSTLEDPPVNFTVGAAGRVGAAWDWQLSFAEDLTGDGPAVDFTLDVQITRRF